MQYYDWQWNSCARAHLSREKLFDENIALRRIYSFSVVFGIISGNFSAYLALHLEPCAHASSIDEKRLFPCFRLSRYIRCKLRSDIFIIFRSREEEWWWWWCRSEDRMRNEAESEERRRGKKVQWNFSIRDFLRNEEINFKIPIVSRTFRLVCTLWALSRESISMAGFGRAGEGVRWFIDVQIIAELRLISVRRTTQLSSRVNSLEIL